MRRPGRELGAGLVGLAFGFWMAWTRMTDFDQVVGALLLRRAYLWLMFATGVASAAGGLHLLRKLNAKTWLERRPIAWPEVRPQARHVVGALVFGAGWALAGVCPGPIAAQIGQGKLPALFTLLGLFAGIRAADLLASRGTATAAAAPCAGEAFEGIQSRTSGSPAWTQPRVPPDRL